MAHTPSRWSGNGSGTGRRSDRARSRIPASAYYPRKAPAKSIRLAGWYHSQNAMSGCDHTGAGFSGPLGNAAARLLDVGRKFIIELPDVTLNRHCRRNGKRADGPALHAGADIEHDLEFPRSAGALLKA